MTNNIYCIWDEAAERWSNLFEAPTDKAAIRGFESQIQQSKYPEDFSLYCFGSWENDLGPSETEEYLIPYIREVVRGNGPRFDKTELLKQEN